MILACHGRLEFFSYGDCTCYDYSDYKEAKKYIGVVLATLTMLNYCTSFTFLKLMPWCMRTIHGLTSKL